MSGYSRRKREMGPEAYVQDAILDWLRAERVLAFRMQVGSAMYQDAAGKGRRVSFGTAGMADILAFPERDGRPFPVWLECKSEAGRLSALQRSFADQVEMAGHVYVVARSVDDAIAAMKELHA